MSRRDYEILKKMGMLWEFFPEATGDYDSDVEEGIIDPDKLSEELY